LPDVPPRIAAIVRKALETDRDKRFPDMAAFAEALQEAAREADIEIELPEIYVHGEGEPIRRRGRGQSSVEVRAGGLPKAPTSAVGISGTPTTLYNSPTTAMPSPAHSPLSAPPLAMPPGPAQPMRTLHDDEFTDPRRAAKIVSALFIVAVLSALGGAGWYLYSEHQRQLALHQSIAPTTAQPAVSADAGHAGRAPRTNHPQQHSPQSAQQGATQVAAADGGAGPTPSNTRPPRRGTTGQTRTIRRNNSLTIRRRYQER
jgi:hypothetical protein